LDQTLVTTLGDEELNIGVRYVTSQMFVAAGVVQPDHRGSYQSGTTQREHVVRGVVEEYSDVGRAPGVQPGSVEGGEAFGFGQQFFVSPDLITESKGRTGRGTGFGTVASQKDGHIRSGKRHLVEGWGDDPIFGHFGSHPT
jgi:hypothetical protein